MYSQRLQWTLVGLLRKCTVVIFWCPKVIFSLSVLVVKITYKSWTFHMVQWTQKCNTKLQKIRNVLPWDKWPFARSLSSLGPLLRHFHNFSNVISFLIFGIQPNPAVWLATAHWRGVLLQGQNGPQIEHLSALSAHHIKPSKKPFFRHSACCTRVVKN